MNKMVTSLKNKARYAANSVAPVAVMLGTAVLTSSSAFAADPKELLKFIIKTVGGLIIALGIIMFVMGLVRWASAHSEGDGPAQNKAIGMLAAAVMLVALSMVLTNDSTLTTLANFL